MGKRIGRENFTLNTIFEKAVLACIRGDGCWDKPFDSEIKILLVDYLTGKTSRYAQFGLAYPLIFLCISHHRR